VGRLTMGGAFLSVALGSMLVLPVAAQAATSAPAVGVARIAASAGHQAMGAKLLSNPQYGLGPPEWAFTGLTYPATTAGLSACNAEGEAWHNAVPSQNIAWQCKLNNPDAGYDLWNYFRAVED